VAQSHVSIGGSGAEVDGFEFEVTEISVVEAVESDECGSIDGVGDIAYLEGAAAAVGEAFGTHPEGHLKLVDGSAEGGQNYQVGGGTAEAQGIAGAMSEGSAGGNSARANFVPAVGEVGGKVVEVFEIGDSNGVAGGGEANRNSVAAFVVDGTERFDGEVVCGAAAESSEVDVVGVGRDGGHVGGVGSVGDDECGSIALPADGGAMGSDVANCYASGSGASGSEVDVDIIDEPVPGAGIGIVAQGNAAVGRSIGEADDAVLGAGEIGIVVGFDCNESGCIIVIGDITYREGAAAGVGEAFRTGPDGHFELIGGGVHDGQKHEVGG